jgi:hypothetical protein
MNKPSLVARLQIESKKHREFDNRISEVNVYLIKATDFGNPLVDSY